MNFYNEMRYINLRFTYLLTYLFTDALTRTTNNCQKLGLNAEFRSHNAASFMTKILDLRPVAFCNFTAALSPTKYLNACGSQFHSPQSAVGTPPGMRRLGFPPWLPMGESLTDIAETSSNYRGFGETIILHSNQFND